MEKEEQARVRATVEEILAEVNIEEVSAKQVRDMAAQRTGLDLSSREGKKFVSSVIKKALDSAADASYAEAGAPNPKVPVEREEPEVEEDSRDRCSKKVRIYLLCVQFCSRLGPQGAACSQISSGCW